MQRWFNPWRNAEVVLSVIVLGLLFLREIEMLLKLLEKKNGLVLDFTSCQNSKGVCGGDG